MLNKFLNLKAYHTSDLFDPLTEREMNLTDLSKVLPRSLAEIELSKEKFIPIPEEISAIYSTYRPTPLFRARRFEKAIGTSCEIYIKNEGTSPSGNHKTNSAYLIAYLCKRDGIKLISTETTGNWGLALAMAGKHFGVKVACFMDYESHLERPNRKSLMEEVGAQVIIVEPSNDHKVKDLLTLSADAAIEFTRKSKGTYYIFGSVYSYFIIPQSIIGLEIKSQLMKKNKYPDIVIGACGGGASLLGTAAAFITDIVDEKRSTRIVSAEAESCPILSEGKMGLYSIDNLKYYPLIKTYGIDELKEDKYIGGLGSTVVASSVAFFHSKGLIQVNRFSTEEAKKAAEAFYKSEGILVALETGYSIAALMKQARENENKVIVTNISSGETDRQFYNNIQRNN